MRSVGLGSATLTLTAHHGLSQRSRKSSSLLEIPKKEKSIGLISLRNLGCVFSTFYMQYLTEISVQTKRMPIDCMRHAIPRKMHTWTPESDQRLLEMVKVYGNENWQLGWWFCFPVVTDILKQICSSGAWGFRGCYRNSMSSPLYAYP